MFKSLGRKAAQQNYETAILSIKANPSILPEVRARTALRLRTTARERLLLPNVYADSPDNLFHFFTDFENLVIKQDAMSESTRLKNDAMKLRAQIGISPDYVAMQILAGYLQMISQCSKGDLFTKGKPDKPASQDGVELRKFREMLLQMFDGYEEFLFTDVVDKAAAAKGVRP